MLVFLAVFFRYAGDGIVAVDPPEKGDLIIVLMGSGPDRILGAVDLYEQGYAPCIVMVENWQPGYELLQPRGVDLPRDAELAAMAGVELGIPEEAFVILPGDARSTQDEALIVTQYLKEQKLEVDKVLLVTSKFHSLRSALIFRWALGGLDREVNVLSCPTPYDNFNAAAWWQSREDAKRVVMEYAKLVNFYLLDRWR
ncbi:MAG: YdcF family protein [Syntrophomonadaceae bacterium]|nr:YdcF family protein [Syntrophomonadaceae bacterium]